MVKLLIEAGADVNGYAPGDETPLINAAATGYVEIARYLIARGADVNLAVRTNHERAGKTRSPMSQATKHGHGDMIELLEASGAE